jgi:ribosomal protein S18 acetylase RimI-like enzyme
MSFWSQSPGPHWSDLLWSCLSGGAVFPQPIRRYKLDKPKAPVCYRADETRAEEIAEFLGNHFKITEKSKCCITSERILEGLNTGWIIAVKLDSSKHILGTIISRPLGICTFHNGGGRVAKVPNTAYIDFFCVHPDYRRSRIGSDLLFWIEYYTNQKGIFIHLFQKELSPLFGLPPLWQGKYIVREVTNSIRNTNIQKVNTHSFDHGALPNFSISFTSKIKTRDSQLFMYEGGTFKLYVALTDTYHKFGGSSIGEFLFYKVESENVLSEKSIAGSIEEILDNSDYKYILMDKSIPHLNAYSWKDDAPYYYYLYNINPRHFWNIRPLLWF